jgi:hypothetical protein
VGSFRASLKLSTNCMCFLTRGCGDDSLPIDRHNTGRLVYAKV